MSNPSWHKPLESADTGIRNADRGRQDAAASLVGGFLLGLIAIYKRFISPVLGPHCRFHPSCSSYAAEAITRYGPLEGSIRALARILRCQPLSAGGYDPVL